MKDTTNNSGRWMAVAIIGGVLALAIVALVREPIELDPDTPQGVVQSYLRAVANDDFEVAQSFLTERPSECVGFEGEFASGSYDFSASLGNVSINGDNATVGVEITESYGAFDGGYTHREQFFLERTDGVWKLSRLSAWPYYFGDC